MGEVEPTWRAAAALLAGRRFVALTGAGLSTDSGIPDYRSPGRPQRTPIQGPAFKRDAAVRARYWARSMVGWPWMRDAAPNPAHRALAEGEGRGLTWTITQNVDGLHQRAGATRVTELHGALAWVVCLGCGARSHRDEVQERLVRANPGLHRRLAGRREDDPASEPAPGQMAPDGDAEVERWILERFEVPGCGACGGVLKPDVVFFGENVPAERVEASMARVDEAEALLVVGSSLTVWSGYRFVRRAAERGLPVVIVNRGETRGDPLAAVKIEGGVGEVLPWLLARLDVPAGPGR